MTWNVLRMYMHPGFGSDPRNWEATINALGGTVRVCVYLGGKKTVDKHEVLPAAKIAEISAALSMSVLEGAANPGFVMDDATTLGMSAQAPGGTCDVTAPALTRKQMAALTSSLSDGERRVLDFCDMWRSIARLLPLPSDVRIP